MLTLDLSVSNKLLNCFPHFTGKVSPPTYFPFFRIMSYICSVIFEMKSHVTLYTVCSQVKILQSLVTNSPIKLYPLCFSLKILQLLLRLADQVSRHT
uniref:AlNc14C359G10972 protein n=1 Tax=Albugo laibachii Nc14 TaxID=890382 RepID=F0WXM2_9STRA|nr:AlNc14C359G10972 [Albugo laibachii Nc14]|eukprot:CCA26216.1 AlNc14C359G10972 [Albugo laibachii Nc14]